MSTGWGITVTQSKLTRHWIVNAGTTTAQGFRRWDDAMAEADARAERYREQCRRQIADLLRTDGAA